MKQPLQEEIRYRKGVGIVLRRHDGAIFAGYRINNNDSLLANKAPQLIQGGLEEGESEDFALWRELYEEAGLKNQDVELVSMIPFYLYYDLPKEMLGKSWGDRYVGQRHRWFLLDIKNEQSINLNAHTDPEFLDFKWLSPQEIVSQGAPFKRETYKAVFSYFFGLNFDALDA